MSMYLARVGFARRESDAQSLQRSQCWGRLVVLTLAMCGLVESDSVSAAELPGRVGTCIQTTVKRIGTRLTDGATGQPIKGSGSAVEYSNKGYQVSYETEPAIMNSRVGDKVRICLISIPQHCPRGDGRGRIYRTTNLRTLQVWTLPDSEHTCGGA